MKRVLLLLIAVIPLSACMPPPPDAGAFPSDAWFYAIGRCEQPGDGLEGIDWTIHGPGYQGGLGLSDGAWEGNRDDTWAINAGDAPPWQQVIAARRVYGYAGASAWGCTSVAGEPY